MSDREMIQVVLTKPGRVSLLPRWCHKLVAHTLGFFWLPCPICGEMFGGHEWRWPYSSQTDPETERACCPRHRLVAWKVERGVEELKGDA